jgi:hypothetical protein
MLPIEVEHKAFRVQHFIEEQSDNFVNDLTRLEELRKATVIWLAKHQHSMSNITRETYVHIAFR